LKRKMSILTKEKEMGKRTALGVALMMGGAFLAAYGQSAYASGQLRASARAMSQAHTYQDQTALGGDSSTNIDIDNKRQLPFAPGLSAGSSNSTGTHRIYQQRQGSFLLGGWTIVDMVLDLPAFVGSEPSDDEQLAACVQDANFREYRRLQNNPCPQDK